ncbi:hypothetical protein Awo_c34290 [Acetobacterium woodii DSM 1030]|uniref:Uncharacterized protein n=1 Tax=Acetobacterium woodii (strain ATCC 29683 / DSM 1030 / JCM 2381 / KCTC 1655 / WB1) TaxID=931626 RepID=H6LBN2_ACEWD|nr:hypothetical protein Awo_c34290 [Acetobacterium woodii DSM 1030]
MKILAAIEFMGTHPLYRKKGMPKAFLDKVMGELIEAKEIWSQSGLRQIEIVSKIKLSFSAIK